MKQTTIISFGLFMLLLPLSVGAIPPPDLLLSGLQSVVQLFGVALVFIASGFFLARDYLLSFWHQHRKIAMSLIVVIGLILGGLIYGFFFNDLSS